MLNHKYHRYCFIFITKGPKGNLEFLTQLDLSTALSTHYLKSSEQPINSV